MYEFMCVIYDKLQLQLKYINAASENTHLT